MLSQLTIQDFALFDRLTLEFGPGFNVLTGETGAGKSILIDALMTALGERAGPAVVRAGADTARVEAVFELAGDAPAALAEWVEDGQVLFTREVGAGGRSACRLNGRLCPTSLAREVASHLLDVHGQHEHQSLLTTARHGEFLDAWAGAGVAEALAAGAAAFERLRSLRAELRALREDERDRAQRLDLYRFQVEEIAQAALSPGEEDALRAERNRLANAERLLAAVGAAAEALSRGEASAEDLLGSASAELTPLADLDPEIASVAELIEGAAAAAQEAARALARYEEGLEFNPERLEEVQARLELIRTLRRKYGDTIAEVLAYADRVAADLQRLEHGEERADELLAAVTEAEGEFDRLATELHARRSAAGERFAGEIARHLADLGMADVRFEADVPAPTPAAEAPEAGLATLLGRVQFLLATNPGQPLRPLARVASGGETSRLMLAIKSALADANPVPTLIFDEIDVGVGGHAASVLGEKLAALARQAQVLCVTHLPQIACMADTHLRVAKSTRGDAAVIRVEPLDGDARIEELARMLGGRAETAREHARELLAAGRAPARR